MLLFITGVTVLVYITIKVIWQWNYWKKKGAPFLTPFPILGKMTFLISGKGNLATMAEDVYFSMPDKRYVGYFQFLMPMLMIRDPELIKQITIKDFDYFSEHVQFASAEQDPLWSNNLFSAKTSKWRELRPTMSPIFTASKLRGMVNLIEEVAQQLVEYLRAQGEELRDVDLNDIFTRFTNDVIATTAFGLKCDSFKDKSNKFYLAGKELTDFGGTLVIRLVGNLFLPAVMKFLNISIFPKSTTDFFRKIIEDNIKERTEKGITRPDLIDILLEAQKHGLNYEDQEEKAPDASFAEVQESDIGKKGHKKHITDEDILAQAFVFFFAGYAMVSTLMCLTIYELALQTDIQERLRTEINQHWSDGPDVSKMKYLDMVVSETLRKWAPTIVTDRVAVKPYVIEPKLPGEKPVLVDVGTVVVLPMWPMHRDPKLYADPEKFDPERFSDANKGKIVAGTYYPFGMGPRNCIGSRFALMEAKILIAYVLKNFEVFPTTKTQIPLTLKKRSMNFQVAGYWMGFKEIPKVSN